MEYHRLKTFCERGLITSDQFEVFGRMEDGAQVAIAGLIARIAALEGEITRLGGKRVPMASESPSVLDFLE